MPKLETIGGLLHWSYANLHMARDGEKRGIAKYDNLSWWIRIRLFSGLRDGTMNVSSLFADVRDLPNDRCVYCAAEPPPKLQGDHLIPRSRGGPESGDNLVRACKPCNLRKHARDLLEWYASQDRCPPLALVRRYLKLSLAEASEKGLMDAKIAARPEVRFSIDFIPIQYPQPGELGWTVQSMTRPVRSVGPEAVRLVLPSKGRGAHAELPFERHGAQAEFPFELSDPRPVSAALNPEAHLEDILHRLVADENDATAGAELRALIDDDDFPLFVGLRRLARKHEGSPLGELAASLVPP